MLTRSEQVSLVKTLFQESIVLKQRVIQSQAETIAMMGEAMCQSLEETGKILLCGNGGSAADAQHLAAELLVRLRPHVNREGVPALALATDASLLTACGNDYSSDAYYGRMICALGRLGDVLIGITASGKSPNVVRALHAARTKAIVTVGLLGGDGNPALTECDLALVVPSTVTGRIQETHITVSRVG